MKFKNILIIPLLGAILALPACDNEVEDVFELKTDARLKKTVNDCRTVLTSSTHGWRLAYEPNPNYCARFFMKFSEGSVFMKSDFSATSSNSSYAFDFSQGPVLKFDTYGLIHYLSDPSVPPTGTGYGGDFEFIVMQVKADSVFLKGKKNQDRVVLCKAGEGDEDNYFLNSTRLKSFLAKNSSTPFFCSVVFPDETGAVFAAGKNNRYMNFFVPTSSGVELKNVSYDFDGKGFSLDQEIAVAGKLLRFFEWDNENQRFGTQSGGGILQLNHTTPLPLDKTVEKYSGSTLVVNSYSPLLTTIYDKLKASVPIENVELVWDVNSAKYWNFVINNGGDSPDNIFDIATIEKLRDDQVLFTDAQTSAGSSVARLKRNTFFKQLLPQMNSVSGFTVFENENLVYLINREDSRYWIAFTKK